jgi:hypothetical protein
MRRGHVIALALALCAPRLAHGRNGAEWAAALAQYHFLASDGLCAPVRFHAPPCGGGDAPFYLVDNPHSGRRNALTPLLTTRRGLPRSTPLCARGARSLRDVFLSADGRGVVALVNEFDSHVADLTTTRSRCETYARAQADAQRSGEPY